MLLEELKQSVMFINFCLVISFFDCNIETSVVLQSTIEPDTILL